MGINSSLRATGPTLPCFIAQRSTGDSLGCRWWPAGGVKTLSSALAQADLEPASKQRSFAYSFPQPASSWTYTNSPWQWLGAVLLLGTQPGPALCLASCLFSYLWSPPSRSSCFLKHRALLLRPLPPRNHGKHLQEVSVRLNLEPPHCTCCPTSIHHSICAALLLLHPAGEPRAKPVYQILSCRH